MIALLLSAQFMLGTMTDAPHPETIAALEKRGLSTHIADFPAGIAEAFAKRDKDLFLAMAKSMELSVRAEYLADQVIRLYEALPEDDFKESIAVPLAYSLQLVERVMQSRWACEFYGRAMKVMYGKSSVDERIKASFVLERLSSVCGLTLAPYMVKAALIVPDDQIIFGEICIGQPLENRWSSVTSAMAYHILQRYANRPGTVPNEEIVGPIREHAKPLLDAKQSPPRSSREDVLKELDALIAADGKKLCDKYSKMEYKPAPPPPPHDPDEPTE